MKTPLTASSATDCKRQPMLFQDLGSRKVVADFSGGTLSSDGGVLLLREVDARLGLTCALAQCFGDERQQVFVDHSVRQLLAQRVYGLALGYEDVNDHAQLRRDPLLATACDKKDPLGEDRFNPSHRGLALAGPSTLNRLELSNNREHPLPQAAARSGQDRSMSFAAGGALPAQARHRNRDRSGCHGAFGCTASRKGGTSAPTMAITVICRSTLWSATFRCGRNCAPAIRTRPAEWCRRWKRWWRPFANAVRKARIIVRGDSGFCREEILAWCEGQRGSVLLSGFGQELRVDRAVGAGVGRGAHASLSERGQRAGVCRV